MIYHVLTLSNSARRGTVRLSKSYSAKKKVSLEFKQIGQCYFKDYSKIIFINYAKLFQVKIPMLEIRDRDTFDFRLDKKNLKNSPFLAEGSIFFNVLENRNSSNLK